MGTLDELVSALRNDGVVALESASRSVAEVDQDDVAAFQGGLDRGRRFAAMRPGLALSWGRDGERLAFRCTLDEPSPHVALVSISTSHRRRMRLSLCDASEPRLRCIRRALEPLGVVWSPLDVAPSASGELFVLRGALDLPAGEDDGRVRRIAGLAGRLQLLVAHEEARAVLARLTDSDLAEDVLAAAASHRSTDENDDSPVCHAPFVAMEGEAAVERAWRDLADGQEPGPPALCGLLGPAATRAFLRSALELADAAFGTERAAEKFGAGLSKALRSALAPSPASTRASFELVVDCAVETGVELREWMRPGALIGAAERGRERVERAYVRGAAAATRVLRGAHASGGAQFLVPGLRAGDALRAFRGAADAAALLPPSDGAAVNGLEPLLDLTVLLAQHLRRAVDRGASKPAPFVRSGGRAVDLLAEARALGERVRTQLIRDDRGASRALPAFECVGQVVVACEALGACLDALREADLESALRAEDAR